MKFQEDIFNGFHINTDTILSQNCFLQSSKGNDYKNTYSRVMVVVLCKLSYGTWKFHEDTLNGFNVTERTRFCLRN